MFGIAVQPEDSSSSFVNSSGLLLNAASLMLLILVPSASYVCVPQPLGVSLRRSGLFQASPSPALVLV